MSDVFTLKLNGKRFDYWQRVQFRQSVDDLACNVNLTLTQDNIRTDLGLNANTVAEFLINDVLVATVRVDLVRRTKTEDTHNIELSARSLARELIDCQYSITLKKISLHEIVKRICTTFKVPVNTPKTSFIVPDFSMQCESPANAILNAARAGNVLIYPTPVGGLIMTEPSDAAPVCTLVEGQHIKAIEVIDEYAQRFSEYMVKNFDYLANKSQKGSTKDADLTFFRPMHIVADRHCVSLGALQRRATLERNRRLARAHSLRLTLDGAGYEQEGVYKTWQINTQVRVLVPSEGIDDVMLIGDCEITQDDQSGTISELTVMHRNAFVGESGQSKRKSASNKGVK